MMRMETPTSSVITGKASGLESGKVYRIYNKTSGKALDVKGGNAMNGAIIQLYQSNGGANQQWKLIDRGAGTGSLSHGWEPDACVVREGSLW